MLSTKTSRSARLLAFLFVAILGVLTPGCVLFHLGGTIVSQCEHNEVIQQQLFNAFGFDWTFADYNQEGQISLVTNHCFPSTQTFTKGPDEITHPGDDGVSYDGITFENEMSNWIAEMQNCVIEDNIPLDRAKQLLKKVQWIEVPGSMASLDFAQAMTAVKLGRLYGWPRVGAPGESGELAQPRYALFIYLPQGPRAQSYSSTDYDKYYKNPGNDVSDRLHLRYDMLDEMFDMLCGCYPRSHSSFDTAMHNLLELTQEGHSVPVMVHSKSYSSPQALNIIRSMVDNSRMIMHYSVGPSFGLYEVAPYIGDSQDSEMLSASYDCTEVLAGSGGTDLCWVEGEIEIGGLLGVDNLCDRDEYYDVFGNNARVADYVNDIEETYSPMCLYTSINDGPTLYNTGSVYTNEDVNISGWDDIPPLGGHEIFEPYLGNAIVNNESGFHSCFSMIHGMGDRTTLTSPADDCHIYTNNMDLFDAIKGNLNDSMYHNNIQVIGVSGDGSELGAIDWKDEDEPGHLEYWETSTNDGNPVRANLWPSIKFCDNAFDQDDPTLDRRKCRACREADVMTDPEFELSTGGAMVVSREEDSKMAPRVHLLEYPDDGNLVDYDVIYLGVDFYDDIVDVFGYGQFQNFWYGAVNNFDFDEPGQFSMSARKAYARLTSDIRILDDLRLNDEIKGVYNYFKRVDNSSTLDSFYVFSDWSRAPGTPKFFRQNRFFHFDWDVAPLNNAGGLYFDWGCAGAWFKIKTLVYYDGVSDDGAPGYTSKWFDTPERKVLFMRNVSGDGQNPTKPVPIATSFSYSSTMSAADTSEYDYVYPFIPGNTSAIGSSRYSNLYVYGPGLGMRWLSTSTQLGGPMVYANQGHRFVDRFWWNPNSVYCTMYPDSIRCGGAVSRPAWTGTLMVVMMNDGEYFVQEYPITLSP